MTLTDLALKYGCDKLHSHSYIPFYTQLFEKMNVRRLLEIGIGYRELMEPFVPFFVPGASLKMWQEYFPQAEIYACDIREDTLINEGRIHSFLCDQTDCRSLESMMLDHIGDFLDVIIDDGSHVTKDQILTAETLLPYLDDGGGVYVIEDVQEPNRIVTALDEGKIFTWSARPDDRLVVIRR